ncbi:hypothetical protein [Acinetobacter schindleri]|uniref:hypothetical protein n=3 Tax=Acinetobacter schindleri TaxID=108981 RepID=UPI0013B06FC2|nr:hypothetical protein [Acinetobacter schindleri]QIC63690.1 hypothetical protein FSC11_04710 [Acinetobacter schindleri]
MAIEEKQALVLEQPKDQKVYLDLQHSTDTTAIWSFAIAMVIAFILGISATIIAIWYGRKSFDLTKQSFDSLVKQIESSEKITVASNNGLAQSQADSKLTELRFLYKNSEIQNLRKMIADYFATVVALNTHMVFKVSFLKDNKFLNDNDENKYIHELFDEIKRYANEIFTFSFQIDLMLDMDNSNEEKKIGNELNNLNKALNKIIGNLAMNKKDIIDSVVEFGFVFDRVKEKLTKYILAEIQLHKGE